MTGEGRQLLLAGLAAALALTALHHLGDGSAQRTFGPVHPLPVALAILLAGLAGLRLIRSASVWPLEPRRNRGLGAAWLAFGMAVAFAIAVTVADMTLRFRADINVAGWAALVFYPAVAVLAVICFHILPMAVIVGARAVLGRSNGQPLAFLPAAFFAALVEPAFQISAALGRSEITPPDIYTVGHVFAFNLAALYLLRTGGFFPALLLRLAYYGWWHLIWGALRLEFLFG